MTSFHWDVEDLTYTHDKGREPAISGLFAIRDCHNAVAFDCYASKRKHIKKHRRMINKLMGELLQFDEALAAMTDEVMPDE